MAAARIAAVFVALICLGLSAQLAPQGNVIIQVTDITGAIIPGASMEIEIDHSPYKPESFLKADGRGQVVLNLPAGSHVLSITAQWFKTWLGSIDVQSGSQVVTAQLELDPAESGTRVMEEPYFRYDPDLQTKPARFEILIAPRPLLNLDPLPLKSARRRW